MDRAPCSERSGTSTCSDKRPSPGAPAWRTPGARANFAPRLASQRQNASADLAEALRSDRYLNLLDRLDAGTSFSASPSAGGPNEER